VVVSVAPLLVAVVLWAVTGSMFALLFAVFGPVTAVASFVDSRLGARRSGRREKARFEQESASCMATIDEAHAAERAALSRATPPATDLLDRTGADPWRWRTRASEAVPVDLGLGDRASSLVIDGPAPEELVTRAATLSMAPSVVDARLGIGVCGVPQLAAAFARGILLQLAWTLSPAAHWCAAAEPWGVPHRTGRPVRAGFMAEFGPVGAPEASVVLAVAPTERELPGECRIVVRIDATGARIIEHPDAAERRAVRASLISSEAARAWAERATADAVREGLVAPRLAAAEVRLATLLHGQQQREGGLACSFATDGQGPTVVDLVEHGPHAVVGGTTGSGKSELLVSWVIAMAATHPPSRVTFLLVDFKGGSAFAPLVGLPHTVGIVTDLDEAEARRALESLRAELRYRERRLVAEGARDIDRIDGMPRLVIVVDEFAAMLSDHPELHALFADIASRGRALGVHLLLCTQRPAGVVRDSVLANADLRLSLRVNNRADSTAVVGTDEAADLPVAAKGAAILAHAAIEPSRVQVALASDADVQLVAQRFAGAPAPRRPWCPPLPPIVDRTMLGDEDEGVPFGLLDLPEEQRHATAYWNPVDDGHLLVVGAARSGKSTAIAALRPTLVVPPVVAAAWDVVAGLHAAHDEIVAIDDLDALLARCTGEYRDALVERLGAALREGPRRGVHFVMGAQRMTADVQSLASLVPARLWLRHSNRQEFVLAGGDSALWLSGLPAGGGLWRGHRVQVVLEQSSAREPQEPEIEPTPSGPIAVVTSRPAALVLRALAAGRTVGTLDEPGDDVVVGDLDEWQSHWGALAAMRQVADVVFDGCSPADYRALTRLRELPPPLVGVGDLAWRLRADGTAARVRLPF
jgi:S-DNA-T family DNA segregation ATPase FtsK/SpoIIIE